MQSLQTYFLYITLSLWSSAVTKCLQIFGQHFLWDPTVKRARPVCVWDVMCRDLFEAAALTSGLWFILLAPAQGLLKVSPENSAVTLWILNFFVPSHLLPSVSMISIRLFQIAQPSFLSAQLFRTLIPLLFLFYYSPLLGPSCCILRHSVKKSLYAARLLSNRLFSWQVANYMSLGKIKGKQTVDEAAKLQKKEKRLGKKADELGCM